MPCAIESSVHPCWCTCSNDELSISLRYCSCKEEKGVEEEAAVVVVEKEAVFEICLVFNRSLFFVHQNRYRKMLIEEAVGMRLVIDD